MGCSLGHRLDSNPRMFRVYNVDVNGEARNMGRIEITEEDLIFHQKGKEAVCWPLRSLRRYGFDAELFSFESGRRCPTGQGFYVFKCQRAEALFNLLQECIQLAGEQQQQQHVDHNPSVSLSTRPPPQLEAWPPDSQLPTYVNREVIVAAASNTPEQPQHQYVNTGTLNGRNGSGAALQQQQQQQQQQQTQASPASPHTNGPNSLTSQLNYAQLDLLDGGGGDAATYVNVSAAETTRRPSPSHLVALPAPPQPVEANTVVPPPDLSNCTAGTPPMLAAAGAGGGGGGSGDNNGDIQYIQVEIVNDSAPASPAPTAVETYSFPPTAAEATGAAGGGGATAGTPVAARDDKYAVIDFDKTYAINAKSNHDNEGVRKTRHNSNLEDCA